MSDIVCVLLWTKRLVLVRSCSDLGCGKTCLARGFVRAHTQQKELAVTSPTYLLVNTYDEAVDLPMVYHIDLYRLETMTEQDVTALGLIEAFARGRSMFDCDIERWMN